MAARASGHSLSDKDAAILRQSRARHLGNFGVNPARVLEVRDGKAQWTGPASSCASSTYGSPRMPATRPIYPVLGPNDSITRSSPSTNSIRWRVPSGISLMMPSPREGSM
jgi:hypothetical protein